MTINKLLYKYLINSDRNDSVINNNFIRITNYINRIIESV